METKLFLDAYVNKQRKGYITVEKYLPLVSNMMKAAGILFYEIATPPPMICQFPLPLKGNNENEGVFPRQSLRNYK